MQQDIRTARYPSRRTPLQPPLQNNTNSNTIQSSKLVMQDKSKPTIKKNQISSLQSNNHNNNNQPTTTTTTSTTPSTIKIIDIKVNSSSSTLESTLMSTILKHTQTNDHTSALFHANLLYSIQKTPVLLVQIALLHFQLHDYANAVETIMHHSLHSTSVQSLYTALLSLINLKRYNEALDLCLESRIKEFKLDPQFYFYKGSILLNLDNQKESTECFTFCLKLDPTMVSALKKITENYLMSEREELLLIQSLDYAGKGVDPEFYIALYTTLIHQYTNSELYQLSMDKLTITGTSDSIDCQISDIKRHIQTCNYQKAQVLLKRSQREASQNKTLFKLETILLFQTKNTNALYLHAHQTQDLHAIGAYQLLTLKFSEARATFEELIDWIGLGHALAGAGECDQAIHAYATASKMMPECHLPSFFIGQQYLIMHNTKLANEFFTLSKTLTIFDPQLENEFGVCLYSQKDFSNASRVFEGLIDKLGDLASEKQWMSVWQNLGMSLIKQCCWDKARDVFDEMIRFGGDFGGCWAGLAFLDMMNNSYDSALMHLHKAVRYDSEDVFAGELMEECMSNLSSLIMPPNNFDSKALFKGLGVEEDENESEDFWLPASLLGSTMALVNSEESDMDMD